MVALTTKSVAFVLVGMLAASGAAQAEVKQAARDGKAVAAKQVRLAQGNTVVVPSQQPAPAQPAPVVQPVQPVQPVDVSPRKTVTVEDHPTNFMATIAASTFFGVLTGALVGAAVYYLDEPRRDPQHIYYWGAGGAIVGLGIGLINVAANQERSERAVSDLTDKHRAPSGPRALGVRLYSARF